MYKVIPMTFIFNFSKYRVFQMFLPIKNCIFYRTFNASIAKFKLIQLRNLSRQQFKAIYFKLKYEGIKMFLNFLCQICMCACFFHYIFPALFIGFFAFIAVWRPKLFVLELKQVFMVIWPFSQRNYQIVEEDPTKA